MEIVRGMIEAINHRCAVIIIRTIIYRMILNKTFLNNDKIQEISRIYNYS